MRARSGCVQTGAGTHCEVGQLVVGAVGVNAVEVSPRHIGPSDDQRCAHLAPVPTTQPPSMQAHVIWVWPLVCLQLT